MKTDLEIKKRSFVDDARKFSMGWRMWFWLLSGVNLIVPLFFITHPEAWAVLACYLIAVVVLVPLHRRLGWVRLLGIGHFQWFVLLPWLIVRMQSIPPASALGIWLMILIVIDGVCLIIDVVDVAQYWRGDRMPIVT